MVLCDSEILAALEHQQIVIDPVPPAERITTSAVDLTLGEEFKRWKKPAGSGSKVVIDPSQPDFFAEVTSRFLETVPTHEEGVILRPGEFILGITRERVELPISSRLAARVEGRSSLARLGLGIHVTAPTVHSGFRGTITLEITNHGSLPIRLRPGLRVCQLILEQVFGTPSRTMAGMFQDQSTVTGSGQE